MTTSAGRARSSRDSQRRHLEGLVEDLRAALAAITAGGVDAVVLQGDTGSEVYTLATADKPYRVMLEEMGDGAVTVSRTGIVLYANRRFCELVGLSRADVLGHDLREFVVDAARDAATGLLTIAAGETRHFELDLRGLDLPRTAQVAATGMEQAGVPMTCAILTDVTERHQTALLLQEAARRFSAAFDEAPQGMALLDDEGRMLRCNRVLMHLLGLSADLLVGTSLLDRVQAEDRELLGEELAALFDRRRSVVRREVRLVDGPHAWTSFSASLVAARSGDQAVVHLEDISSRKLYEQRLEVLADRDPLTGLVNRRRFREEMERWLSGVARYGTPGALMLLDLDSFKYVNDTLGHHTGDRLLQYVAQALVGRARETDVVGRLGGDEFGVILPSTGAGDARRVAEDYVRMLGSALMEEDGTRLRATASGGVVSVEATDARTAEELLADADVAMYEAKERGGNGVVVFDSGSTRVRRWRERFHALDMVRHALDSDGFVLHAQPILRLEDGAVDGYELLVRLLHEGEVVMPSVFLDIAESHGLGPAIDRWVVKNALREIAAADAEQALRWEINLSAASLVDEELLATIEQLLPRAAVSPANIVFEITETAAIANMAQAKRFVRRVADLGCRFALDDFGAGYGSFYYLKHLPFDFLKIDGEFVRDLVNEPHDGPIVAAIVTAARALGKQTIAEYVQDQETVALLRDAGVDHAQGFHIGRPQPLREAMASIPAQRTPAGAGLAAARAERQVRRRQQRDDTEATDEVGRVWSEPSL